MDELSHAALSSLFRETRAARERTARVNRGLTRAFVNGEDLFAAYERLTNEELSTEEETNEPEANDSSGLPPSTEEGTGEGE